MRRGMTSGCQWNRSLRLLFFAGGPAYAAAISVAVVTSRRISEVLLLRGDSDEDLGVDQTTTVHMCFQKARLRQALARSELQSARQLLHYMNLLLRINY